MWLVGRAYLKANKTRTMRTMIASDPKTTAIAIITVVVVSLGSDGVGITAEMCVCVCVCVCVYDKKS